MSVIRFVSFFILCFFIFVPTWIIYNNYVLLKFRIKHKRGWEVDDDSLTHSFEKKIEKFLEKIFLIYELPYTDVRKFKDVGINYYGYDDNERKLFIMFKSKKDLLMYQLLFK